MERMFHLIHEFQWVAGELALMTIRETLPNKEKLPTNKSVYILKKKEFPIRKIIPTDNRLLIFKVTFYKQFVHLVINQ